MLCREDILERETQFNNNSEIVVKYRLKSVTLASVTGRRMGRLPRAAELPTPGNHSLIHREMQRLKLISNMESW